MTPEQTLARDLGKLLGYGTLLCSIVIALGIGQQALELNTGRIDLTTIGIIGFILLPILRLGMMMVSWLRAGDRSMMIVPGIVMSLVLAGLIAGIAFR